MQNNLSSVKLGGGLFKVRVASESSGKSSAYRTIVVYRGKKGLSLTIARDKAIIPILKFDR